jgi:hypothetical protein
MIDWTARARATLAQPSPPPTVKTDETRVLSVSSAGFVANADCRKVLSSVSSVATGAVCESNTGSGNPYMTRQQGDDCHAGGWSGAEIATFQAREVRFRQLRRADAEHLAERLTLRDRQHDNRRLCLECRELEISGQCAAVRRGEIRGADPRVEPVPDTLRHCEAFRSPTPLLPSLER